MADRDTSLDKPGSPFDEEIYLRLNPDVRLAVASGAFRSGRDHFERYGRAEGRPFKTPETVARNRVIVSPGTEIARERPKPPASAVDGLHLSQSGGIYVVGWIDDAIDPLESLDLYFPGWSLSFDAQSLARHRRPDAETALSAPPRHAYGFWGFLYAGRPLAGGVCNIVLRLKSGADITLTTSPQMVEDQDLRQTALEKLAHSEYLGNPYFEAVAQIQHAIGAQLVEFNKMLSRRALSQPYIERFGPRSEKVKASFLVCLYGKAEYLFLQNAMFARQSGMADYEFVYVSNSPHLAEALLKEARLAAQIYGISITLILLNSNAGFGAANNIAAEHAASPRLVIMNPDVFPRGPDFITKHNAVLDSLPAAQTALFGAPLYYDDGSLMHGGMYFCADTVPRVVPGRTTPMSILRVEHYGKGAPPETAQFVAARPVPAITGAFMSVDRAWFEKLGGFTQDYVFGHYEDADLCLKSLAAGRPAWLHDVRLWHLEGKGSNRLPEHEGGSVVNRWLFTKTWGEFLIRDLLGPSLHHPAFTQTLEKPAKRRRP